MKSRQIDNLTVKIPIEMCLMKSIFRCFANQEVEVEVMSNYPLPAYTYLIIGKGQIFEGKTFTPEFAPDTIDFVHRFKFTPNSSYAPKVEIIVFCVRSRKIASTHLTLDIHDNPKNFIELNVTPDAPVKIGQSVDISVKSNVNSYIGLLGMDESLLRMRANNDINQEDISNELEQFYEERKKTSPNLWEDFSVSFEFEIFRYQLKLNLKCFYTESWAHYIFEYCETQKGHCIYQKEITKSKSHLCGNDSQRATRYMDLGIN